MEKLIKQYRSVLSWIDTQLYALTLSEHGVCGAVLLVLSYLLIFHANLILLLINGAGIGLLVLTGYVGYRLSMRMEPKDDYE